MKAILITLLLLVSIIGFSQKKVLDHADFEIWNTIENQSITPDGNYIMYSLEKGERDNNLKIMDNKASLVFEHERGERGQFTYDSKFALFTVKAWQDSVKEMKRRKIKKKDMPKDTLAIYNLSSKSLTKIGHVKSYKIPEKWAGYVAYQLDEIKVDKEVSSKKEDDDNKTRKKKGKKVSKDNGYHLVLRNLATGNQDTIRYVTAYIFAKEGKRLAYATTGKDSTNEAGVYVLNLESNQAINVLAAEKGKYSKLAFSETGKNFGFIADFDTTKVQVRPNELYHWQEGMSTAAKLVDAASAPQGYRVSADGTVSFSKDETKLFFGLATPPIIKDTTLLEEEIVNVEVWTYNEPVLYTIQELELQEDKKRSYTTVINLNASNKLVQIATTEFPNATLGNEGNATYALINNPRPYQLEGHWQGISPRDYSIVNTSTGATDKVFEKTVGRLSLSPGGKYIYGYNLIDTTWFTYNIAAAKLTNLTKGEIFYDEINDRPNYPRAYGIAGWTENDASILIYDRYDIWEFNPESNSGTRITAGRENKTSFRYLQLDPEARFINRNDKWLLLTFNEVNKDAGYYELNGKNGKGKQLISGPFMFSRPVKAINNDNLIFTRQSFQEFPDIHLSDLSFKSQTQISSANPQQSTYNWGTSELVNWTSLDGIELEGMLFKPENFDPNKKYPMIVYFYEKSSNRLHRHSIPAPGRSSINYSFYTSRGYLVFNPNINYRIGYPGESAYNCIIPGITSLIEQGFVDKSNIGVQGHSWGGYQIAYLVTRSNIFKAAESGAPVVNMISAYGGIRWGSGMSRQFQYEHTQSRIGGTPWEYPARYIENSPIFSADKINTPLLVLHNDGDTAVPWYQGIEFFTALRRLGKPAWLINYNGEPHGIVKRQNRKDFTIRMAQFFDYYLKGAAMPVWMERGVPAIEKGINQGYELIDNK